MLSLIRALQCFFAALLLLSGGYAVLCELQWLPTHYLSIDPRGTLSYLLESLAYFLTLGGTYGALRLFALRRLRRALAARTEALALRLYARACVVRILLVWMPAALNLVLHYGWGYSPSPAYCLLILAAATLFCAPSSREFERFRGEKSC